MRLEQLNWMDVEAYLQHDDRLILVLGSCEQHAYLSLLTDVKIPQALADAVSETSGVLVAPAVNFGSSPYFLAYPGTLSLRVNTLLDLVEDIVRSAYGHGFRRLLIINGLVGTIQCAPDCTNYFRNWMGFESPGMPGGRHILCNQLH
jgi:creatinine amidohydrolase